MQINRKIAAILFIILLSCAGLPSSAVAQEKTHDYDIVLAGFTIGKMQATEQQTANGANYKIHSKVEFWFFGKIHVEFLQKAFYENGQLIRATTNSDSNRGNFLTTVHWNEDHYDVDANSYKFHNEEPINQPLFLSTAMLYFKEPKAGEVLISENFGMPTKIVELEKGVYEIEVNGNMNRFHYENGVLQKVVLENSIKNYSIRRVSE
ncbi:hypothetical protein PBT90_07135 [Algoriphagus halophytocola]|uniref:DUF3108 domain-containing protein n=1 Tax=Algoriphagus halophytocola TaxID=2991499 RepID=A0ABY6MI69_9BACT|nr:MULTISPECIES: DUF6134 family protein [unclassified Algoriphagus]UZD23164.1 hypothetical protein OM944_01455 [Algoriphagus sp. TR-M5]WBL44456.1 hypothetical protein PBT90_07135 [Algoriphagus sp. TR-M9]